MVSLDARIARLELARDADRRYWSPAERLRRAHLAIEGGVADLEEFEVVFGDTDKAMTPILLATVPLLRAIHEIGIEMPRAFWSAWAFPPGHSLSYQAGLNGPQWPWYKDVRNAERRKLGQRVLPLDADDLQTRNRFARQHLIVGADDGRTVRDRIWTREGRDWQLTNEVWDLADDQTLYEAAISEGIDLMPLVDQHLRGFRMRREPVKLDNLSFATLARSTMGAEHIPNA
jgi:hypothetical protein